MSKTLARKEFNTTVSRLAREAGTYNALIANWGALDRTLSPKKALKALALVADVKPSDKAKVTGKSPAKKALTKKAAPKARKVSTEPRTERVSLVNGNVRVITREAGRIVSNRAATKAEAKAAGLKGKTAKKVTAKPAKSAPAKGKKTAKVTERFLSKPARLDYIAAALEQDEEYLDAIREHFGLEGKALPSVRQCAFYALDVQLDVPGFAIGSGYRDMFAAKA